MHRLYIPYLLSWCCGRLSPLLCSLFYTLYCVFPSIPSSPIPSVSHRQRKGTSSTVQFWFSTWAYISRGHIRSTLADTDTHYHLTIILTLIPLSPCHHHHHHPLFFSSTLPTLLLPLCPFLPTSSTPNNTLCSPPPVPVRLVLYQPSFPDDSPLSSLDFSISRFPLSSP